MDANSWTAIGTWVLALGTLALIRMQISAAQKQARLQALHATEQINSAHEIARSNLAQGSLLASAQAVTDLRHRYRCDEMRAHRRRLAKWLLDCNATALKLDGLDDVTQNLFETVGFLTRKGALDPEMVWHEFSFPVLRYYQAFRERNVIPFIRGHFGGDETLYCEFEWLATELERIEASQRKLQPGSAWPSPEQVERFLQREARELTEGA